MFSGFWNSQGFSPITPATDDSPQFSQYGSFGPQPEPMFADEIVPEDTETYGPKKHRMKLVSRVGLKSWRDALKETRIHLPEFLLPWGMFSLLLLIYGLCATSILPVITLLYLLTLCGAFVILSKGKPFLVLAAGCLCSIGLAISMAQWTQSTYLNEYHRLYNQRWYSNVLASENPKAKKDASLMEFSVDSFVDTSRSVGYKMGSLYCVAPVVTSLGQTSAGYWAVGTDCCQERSQFSCGPVLDDRVKTSVVVLNVNSGSQEFLNRYTVAAQMAARTYGIGLLDSPTFVHWTADQLGQRQILLEQAMEFCAAAVFAFLCGALVVALIFPLVDVALVGERAELPYPEQASLMVFGCYFDRDDSRGGRYDPEVQRQVEQDLLQHRACWSGEIIHDYIFFVCNNHMFISCLACHPEHPYSQRERFLTLLVLLPLFVFPVAVVSLRMPDAGLLRILLIVVVGTIPRNILKAYLLKVTVKDSELVLVEGYRSRGRRATRALLWELAFFIMIYMVVALICALCVISIRNMASGDSLISILVENSDGIAFAFVLELVFELFLPKVENEGLYGKTWLIGFFGRWLYENYEMAAQLGADQHSPLQRYGESLLRKARKMTKGLQDLDDQSPQFPS